MWFHLLAAAVTLHAYFWGAGLAGLALPRAWRRWWWVFAPGLGLALQSGVVWAGAHAGLPGTDRYAAWTELLPAGLLVAGWARRGRWREAAAAWRPAVGTAALLAVASWLLVSPMTAGTNVPTTVSLGSCDAADYAAGARVLEEFARDDRTGFLGEPEVAHEGAAEYFFEFWLRLNHFSPSAIIAHNDAILRERPPALTGLTGAALAVLNLPAAVFLVRLALRLRGVALAFVAGVLAFSPVQAYAVYHVALGQLFAVQGIALLTVAVIAAGRCGRPWGFAPLALAGFWLLAGGYNMLLPVCLAPGGVWLIFEAWVRRDWRRAFRVLLMLAAMLAACGALFPERLAGLAERFRLLHQFNFGWPVPLLSPEGWLGLVHGAGLDPWTPGLRTVLLTAIAAAWLAGVAVAWRRRRRTALAALALVVPVGAGWLILARESRVRANASYDAYKLVAVFQPVLVAGLAGGIAMLASGGRARRIAGGVAAAGLLAAEASAFADLRHAASRAPLRVDRPLLALGQFEADPRVGSVNIRIDEFWSRLWANALLLRKPQYFPTHSYEGRRDTPLRGEWDLTDSPVRVLPAAAGDFIEVNDRFCLVRADTPGRVRCDFGAGWHGTEISATGRWRWTAGDAELHLVNPGPAALRLRLTLRARAITPRNLVLRVNGADLATRPLRAESGVADFGEMLLPPGPTVLGLHPTRPAERPAGDERMLSVALEELVLRPMPP